MWILYNEIEEVFAAWINCYMYTDCEEVNITPLYNLLNFGTFLIGDFIFLITAIFKVSLQFWSRINSKCLMELYGLD